MSQDGRIFCTKNLSGFLSVSNSLDQDQAQSFAKVIRRQ